MENRKKESDERKGVWNERMQKLNACLCMYLCVGRKRLVRAIVGIRVYYGGCDERDAYIRMIAMNGKVLLSWTLPRPSSC
jgi:hypothetical protein